MRTPEEDPEARKQRELEQRRARGERIRAARQNMLSMGSDYSSVYGRPSITGGASSGGGFLGGLMQR